MIRYVAHAVAFAVSLTACTSDDLRGGRVKEKPGNDASVDSRGSEGSECYPNDTCNAGLSCFSHLCVRVPADEGGTGVRVGAGAGGPGSLETGVGAGGRGFAGGGVGGTSSSGGLFGAAAGRSGAAGAGGIGMSPCGSRTLRPEPAPVDAYIMFDQSSSMGDPLPNSNPPVTWWQAAQQAVTSFVNDPKAGGSQAGSPALTVGIQYFPLGGIAPQSCMADYKTPDVELGYLPGNAAAIIASIERHQPTSFTPTAAALTGALAHMKEWAPKNVGHAAAVVLVTDGFPTECDPQDITDIAQIARTAFETEPRVRTFVVGFNLGPGGANLKELAVAGGTGAPFLINGGDVAAQFVDAMLSVSSTQLQCEFALPSPPMGGALDVSQVAVTYTPNSTMVEALIPKLNGLGDCELNMNDGWYYDSPTSPAKIMVCPGTCAKVAAGVVRTATGCPSSGIGR